MGVRAACTGNEGNVTPLLDNLMATMPLAAPSPPVFDPGTLNLTSWNRDNFAMPWLGSTSIGISDTSEEADGSFGAAPVAGIVLDGKTSIHYDTTKRSQLQLVIGGSSDIGNYVATLGYSVWGLIYITSAPAFAANPYENPLIVSGDARYGVYITSDHGLGVYHYTGAFPHVDASNGAAPCSVGAWHFFCVRYAVGSGLVQIDIDNVAGTPTAIGAFAALAGLAAMIARNTYSGTAASFDIRERATSKVVISDADRDNVYGYFKATYPSAGLP